MLTLAGIIAGTGCRPEEGIRHYTVPKQADIDRLAGGDEKLGAADALVRQRMLAAVVLRPSQGWFFKVMGPEELINAQAEAFSAFLKSVHFHDDATPQWSLPVAWHEEPGNQFRYATLTIDRVPLEVSVTTLPRGEVDASEYVLNNVNRWRGQIGLEPTTEREMEQHVEPIDVGADQGQYMEMMGDDKATIAVIAKAAGRAWFIKLTGDRSLVERQRDHFKSFVHSLSIGDTTGATDGK
ncbi:MAG: hypothetical protein B7Z73_03820 [Planctomycetia bacterium 21-64-5]|nr:MAG: hypothetical protein B7Z73_03820 [Planctomycetia bacterium 21-64-5]